MESRGLNKPTQQKDYLSDIRNSIKVSNPDHHVPAVIDFDKATWIQINNRNSDRISQRATKFIDNPNEKNSMLQESLVANRDYFDYRISDGKGNVDGRLGIKLNLPSIKVIEQFANYHTQLLGYQQQSLAIPVNIDSLDIYQDSIRNLSQELLAVDIRKVKPNSLAEDKARSNDLGRPKHSNRQIISTMKQTTKTHKDLVIPAFLHSRLEVIASQLEVSSDKTIEELFKWTEIGLALARELNLDEPDPNMVFHSVQAFKQQSTNSGFQQHDDLGRIDSAELASAKQQLASLTKSLERLTEIWHSFPINTARESEKKQRKRVTEASSTKKANAIDHTSNDLQHENFSSGKPEDNKRERRKSSTKIIRRDNSETVIADINHAIDAVMAFNDAEERLYNQKFYIGIGSVKELSNRGDAAIRRVLNEREEEIQNHLAAYELDKNHNLSRRDEGGNEYPTIDVEPGINYEKITKVNSD